MAPDLRTAAVEHLAAWDDEDHTVDTLHVTAEALRAALAAEAEIAGDGSGHALPEIEPNPHSERIDQVEALAVEATEPPPDDEPEAVMPRVGGKPFRCSCGGNVFTRRGSVYTCNSCRAEYEGAPDEPGDDDPLPVLRGLLDHAVRYWSPRGTGSGPFLAEWDDTDWADSTWTEPERVELRAALDRIRPDEEAENDA